MTPLFNALKRAQEEYLAGNLKLEDFEQAINYVDRSLKNTIIEFNKYKDEKMLPEAEAEIPKIEEAFEQHEEGIEYLLKYVLEQDEQDMTKGMNLIEEATKSLIKSFENFQKLFQEALEDGRIKKEEFQLVPTSIHLETLTKAGEGVLDGRFTLEEYKAAVEYSMLAMNKTINDYNIIKSNPSDSSLVEEEYPNFEKGFEMHILGLEEMLLYAEEKKEEHIRKGLEIIRQATKILFDATAVCEQVLLTAVSKTCLVCGTPNPREANVCSQCNAQLIDSKVGFEGTEKTFEYAEEAESEIEINENVEKLYDAANDVVEGSITMEQFEEVIEWMKDLVINAKDEALSARSKEYSSSDEKKVVQDTADLMLLGLDHFDAGLERMRKYVSEQEISHLTAGFVMVMEASGQLQRIIDITDKIEEKNNDKVTEEAEVK